MNLQPTPITNHQSAWHDRQSQQIADPYFRKKSLYLSTFYLQHGPLDALRSPICTCEPWTLF